MSEQVEQIFRDRFLTPEEIARDTKIREAAQKEFPPVTSIGSPANREQPSRAWMIRSGGAGDYFEKFASGFVAIGWSKVGDLTNATNRDVIRDMYRRAYPDDKPGAANGAVAMLYKFRNVVQKNDRVITYDPQGREYLVGTIASDYFYDPKLMPNLPQVRKAIWKGRVSRDKLPVSSRNSLGSTLTLFTLDDDVWNSIYTALHSKSPSSEDIDEEKTELAESREDTASKAHELIKDQIAQLDELELEQLTAALLRAMGYRTRLTPRVGDRGVDVLASPDGLGLQEPRIKVEVKHRKTAMGSQDLRSFLGGLREGDRGMYVSTGGFTKEAGYEGDRSKIPVTLLDLDDLVSAIVSHYESFDTEGRALLPLVRVYWPVPS